MLNTPYLQATMEVGLENRDFGEIGDWENEQKHDRDPNCIIKYGVKDGVAFFQKTQNNMDDWVTLAAAKRDEFHRSSASQRTKLMGMEKYGLPEILVDEFEARGITISEVMSDDDHYEIDRIMVTEYPDLLWVPASYIALRPKRTIIN